MSPSTAATTTNASSAITSHLPPCEWTRRECGECGCHCSYGFRHREGERNGVQAQQDCDRDERALAAAKQARGQGAPTWHCFEAQFSLFAGSTASTNSDIPPWVVAWKECGPWVCSSFSHFPRGISRLFPTVLVHRWARRTDGYFWKHVNPQNHVKWVGHQLGP